MFFKFSCEILGLRQHMQDVADIKFRFELPLPAVIHLSSKYSDGEETADPSSVICVGITTGEIGDERCAAEIHCALSNPLDRKWANFGGIAPTRTRLIFAALDKFFEPLRVLMESTVSTLRWRSGLSECLNDPFRIRREHLSDDGESWLEVSTVRGLRISQIPSPRQIAASPQLEKDMMKLVIAGTEEPLGHQLFREAWNLRSSHPRSALVIGVAAA